MKMGEDVVETWWKHWETLPKHGEIPASQYRLPTHVHRKYCGIVGPEMQHFTDVLESLSICKARVKLDGSEKPVSLDATRHLPVFWMVRIWQIKLNG